ncbi:hypothetical protein PRZ48_010008 [Zasmidium cellare]|uniref:Uncharacterized protein n=1 Tax=Zasmidium cellare TaxID=395010 RepID=A0ABR0EEJ1_ZASCE|nr:hypothetical protein PRZ48_010008 [Zasmidium cellare]
MSSRAPYTRSAARKDRDKQTELRNEVYGLLLKCDKPISMTYDPLDRPHPLLLVNKEVRSEGRQHLRNLYQSFVLECAERVHCAAANIFYGENVFAFDNGLWSIRGLEYIDPEHVRSLRNIVLEERKSRLPRRVGHVWHCSTKIELDFSLVRFGAEKAVKRSIDQKCQVCIKQSEVVYKNVVEAIGSMESRDGKPLVTREKLEEIIIAAGLV